MSEETQGNGGAADKPRVAVMGLGLMGAGMAKNLLAKGFPVTVYNRSPERTKPFEGSGARIASSPRDAAQGAQFIISMVSDDGASRSVWMGEQGAISGAPPGAIFIESGTVTVGWVRELGEAAKAVGFELLDAPVTGSRVQADAGQLLFLVGGTGEALAKARPVLDAMSRDVVHLGPSGSGTLLKLVNNFLCGVHAASIAEALGVIEHSGLDRDQALSILTNGAPGGPLVKTLSARMTERAYDPNFVLKLMLKDLTYAAAEGARNGVELKTAAAAGQVFARAVEKGFGDQDLSAVVEQFR